MLPVAYRFDGDDATEQRVASVQKASRLAEQLAGMHAEQARVQGMIRAGGLDGWIAEALQVMGLPQRLAPGVKKIILAESGGNPHAINTWDSNAVRGTPSRGLMQTIPSTFRTYVHPELADRPITDPVANITAGVRYMIDRYGWRRSRQVAQRRPRQLSRVLGHDRRGRRGTRWGRVGLAGVGCPRIRVRVVVGGGRP
jgi:SLT domain-containing protein